MIISRAFGRGKQNSAYGSTPPRRTVVARIVSGDSNVQQIEVAMLAMVLALAVTQGPVVPAPPKRYRLETTTTSEQDLTAVGKGKLSGGLTTTAFISVALTDSATGQIARLTLDSTRLAATGEMAKQLPPAVAAAAADSARGAFVQAFTMRGSLRGAPQASSASPALASLLQAISVLFPGLRANMKVGDSWADTSVVNNDVQGGHQTGRIIATWKVDSLLNGGFVLDGTSVTDITVKATSGQTLHKSGSSKEHLVMSSRWPVRSARIESTTDDVLTGPQSPTPIPGRNVATLKLTPIP
jgi:hypothetical protein